MGSKFILNPWLKFAQKNLSALLSFQSTPVCVRGACTARRNSGEQSDVRFDLRADETLGSKSGTGGESTDLSSESMSNLQTDYLIR